MSKKKWKILTFILSGILLCFIALIVISPVSEKVLAQVTSVQQSKDVKPTDWYFQALQSMVERYGIDVIYSGGEFRGERPSTRGEFARWLSPLMDRIGELRATATADLVTKEDLSTAQKLLEEVSNELQAIKQAKGFSVKSP